MTQHNSRRNRWFWIPAALAALLLVAGAPAVWAGGDDDDSSDDDEAIPFAVTEVFFELNNTDGDLGIHALIDGEPWKQMSIELPDGRENLNVRLRGRIRRQGLTELFFESAEPTFDELEPEEFFERFPEGTYEVEGKTIGGREMESETEVTHLMPAPADESRINGELLPEDCDEDPVPEVSGDLVITWDPVTHSHPDLGRKNEPIEIVNYEVVLEREDPPLTLSVMLTPDTTSWTVLGDVAESGDEFKVEILAREKSFNQTALESCFVIE